MINFEVKGLPKPIRMGEMKPWSGCLRPNDNKYFLVTTKYTPEGKSVCIEVETGHIHNISFETMVIPAPRVNITFD